MEKEFKSFLHAGVDLAAAASDRFEENIKDLVGKGKISPEEGKKRVDEFIAKSDEKIKEFETKYNDFTGRFKKKNDEEELEDLKQKVADLEAKMGKNSKTSKASASK